MYNVYRSLRDISERTPTNYRWALQNEAKRHNLTVDELDNIIREYDILLAIIEQSNYEVHEMRTWSDDDDGTTMRTDRLIEFETPKSLENVQLLADALWPRTYCTHEYDCCGHWYYHWPRVEQLAPRVFKVKQGSYQNV